LYEEIHIVSSNTLWKYVASLVVVFAAH